MANESGLDGAALQVQGESDTLIAEERALTDEAIARGLFGAPFYLYRGEPFWGQDRLDLLERVIAGEAAR